MNEVAESFFLIRVEIKFFRNEAQDGAGHFRCGLKTIRVNVHDGFYFVVVLAQDREYAISVCTRRSCEPERDFFLEHEDHAAEGDVLVDEPEVDLGSDVIGQVRDEERSCVWIVAEAWQVYAKGVVMYEGDVRGIGEDFFKEASAVIVFFDEDVRFLQFSDGDGECASSRANFEDMCGVKALDFLGDGARDIFVDEEVLAETFFISVLERGGESSRRPLIETGHGTDQVKWLYKSEKKRRPKCGAPFHQARKGELIFAASAKCSEAERAQEAHDEGSETALGGCLEGGGRAAAFGSCGDLMFDLALFGDFDGHVSGGIGVSEADFVGTGSGLALPGASVFVGDAFGVCEDELDGISRAFNAEDTVIIFVLESRNGVDEAGICGDGDLIFEGEEAITRSGQGVGTRHNFGIDGAIHGFIDDAIDLDFRIGCRARDFEADSISALCFGIGGIFLNSLGEVSGIGLNVIDVREEAIEVIEGSGAIIAHLVDASEVILGISVSGTHFHGLEAELERTIEIIVCGGFLSLAGEAVKLLRIFVGETHTIDFRLLCEGESGDE